MKKVAWFCLLMFVFCPVLMLAQEIKPMTKENLDLLINPPLLNGSDTIICFSTIQNDMGVMMEDDASKVIHFPFQNIGGEPLVITRIVTSCGCTATQFSEQTIFPSEEGKVSLIYHPKNHPGTVDASAFVYTNLSDSYPVARLSLKGNVLSEEDVWSRFPYAIGSLRLKRNQLLFSDITPSIHSTERILCGNSGNTPLRISAVNLPSYMKFRTEPEIIQPGEEADIVVTIDGSKVKAPINKQMKVPITLIGLDVSYPNNNLHIAFKLIK